MYTKDIVIEQIKDRFIKADAVVIGTGAGLSASAGLNYGDTEFFANKYPLFYKKGYKTINDGISRHWNLNEENARSYWGFWCNHINNIFYEPKQLEVYKNLYELVKDKKHYIITTNADGQFFKGNYDPDKIFAMQGSYGYFECQNGCSDESYENSEMIAKMLEGFDNETLLIREEDIPHCPKCNELLRPNVRIDQYFAEKRHMVNKDKYFDFLNDVIDKNVLFLELGVGFNTPVIIRFPFENMTKLIKDACLVRVNLTNNFVNENIQEKSILADMDISDLINQLNLK